MKSGREIGTKECPDCGAELHSFADTCPSCGYQFQEKRGMVSSIRDKLGTLNFLRHFKTGGDGVELDGGDYVEAHILKPSGAVDIEKVSEFDSFEYEKGVYSLEQPFSNEVGKKMLLYRAGNPRPLAHSSEDGEGKLMERTTTRSILEITSAEEAGPELDIIGKLKKIPVWVGVLVLAILVLISQGSLGSIIPF